MHVVFAGNVAAENVMLPPTVYVGNGEAKVGVQVAVNGLVSVTCIGKLSVKATLVNATVLGFWMLMVIFVVVTAPVFDTIGDANTLLTMGGAMTCTN